VYAEQNARVRQVQINVLRCPSDPNYSKDLALSSYAGMHHDVEAPIDVDNHGIFFLNSGIRNRDVSDGLSKTAFVGEKIVQPDLDLGWMSGTRWTLRNTGVPINIEEANRRRLGQDTADLLDRSAERGPLPVGGFGSYHPGGANFAFGDGHVSFISENVAKEALQQIGHRADGELITNADF
jgi:prepilin-type processing-associated H-X9-DG protein